MPSLIAMRAFEAAGRHAGFTQAARELNVTQSAISRQIKALEDQLGVKLFIRNGRTVVLSREGRRLHSVVTDAFGRLIEGARATRLGNPKDTLDISMDPVMAIKWFTPRLVDLMSRHPEIDVRLQIGFERTDYENGDIDAAILYGEGKWDSVEVEEVWREEIVPVCSPTVACADHPLVSARDLEGATLLHGTGREDWRQWLNEAGCPNIDCSGGPRFPDHQTAIEAAISGLGIALGRSLMIAGDVAAGRLVEPFSLRLASSRSYWLATPVDRPHHPQLDMFRAWLKSALNGPSQQADLQGGSSGPEFEHDSPDINSGGIVESGNPAPGAAAVATRECPSIIPAKRTGGRRF